MVDTFQKGPSGYRFLRRVFFATGSPVALSKGRCLVAKMKCKSFCYAWPQYIFSYLTNISKTLIQTVEQLSQIVGPGSTAILAQCAASIVSWLRSATSRTSDIKRREQSTGVQHRNPVVESNGNSLSEFPIGSSEKNIYYILLPDIIPPDISTAMKGPSLVEVATAKVREAQRLVRLQRSYEAEGVAGDAKARGWANGEGMGWMASSWYEANVSRGSPPLVDVGDSVEMRVFDDTGNPQGTIIVCVLEKLGTHRSGLIIAGMFLAASDLYFHWWMNQGEGAPDKDRGVYHLCTEPTAQCPVIKKYKDAVHGDRYRNLGPDLQKSKRIPWLKDAAIKEGYEFSFKKFQGVVSPTGPKSPGSKRPPKTAVTPRWTGEDDERSPEREKSSGSETSGDESESSDKDMKDKIQRLKRELKRAEDEADEGRRKRKAMKKPKEKKKHQSGATGSARDPPKRKGKDKERDRSKDRGAKKKDKKEKRRRCSSSSSRRREHKEKAKKKRRKSNQDDPDESGDESSSREGGLFLSKKPGEPGDGHKDDDRGPFGGGAPVKFGDRDQSSSDSESDFQKGLGATAKNAQMRLLTYTNKHPGRLASRLLLKMQAAVARDASRPEQMRGCRTPQVAMHYTLTVLLPSLGQKAGLRSVRELKTLGSIMDQLAAGSPSRAADIVAQRIKAVERATSEGHWGAAPFLELLPPEHSMLLERDEELFVTREYLLDQRLQNYNKGAPRREGDAKGKSKGGKGKTKDKGDRGAWDKNDKPTKKPESK
eukprot:s905_g20.t1